MTEVQRYHCAVLRDIVHDLGFLAENSGCGHGELLPGVGRREVVSGNAEDDGAVVRIAA